MKTTKCLLFLAFISIVAFANAQTKEEKISDLCKILSRSINESDVKIDNAGNVIRNDKNGYSITFALSDIDRVTIDDDGFCNLLISLKKGKSITSVMNGTKSESNMTVFAFKDNSDCEKAKKLFSEIISK